MSLIYCCFEAAEARHKDVMHKYQYIYIYIFVLIYMCV